MSWDVTDHMYGWAKDGCGKSPSEVCHGYPKMMRKVLRREFGMTKDGADLFLGSCCEGNWDRLHETGPEGSLTAAQYADDLLGLVEYASDRLSWDRVLRIQWLYMRLRDRVGETGC